MAGADYYACSNCGGKAVYDPTKHIADQAGAAAVLCESCAKVRRVLIQDLSSGCVYIPNSDGGEGPLTASLDDTGSPQPGDRETKRVTPCPSGKQELYAMMYDCPCGGTVIEGSDYCPQCGAEVEYA